MSKAITTDPRIDRASRILQPFTSNDYGTSRIQRAINDAFNVLQWGKTVPEEEVEELTCPKP